MSGIGGVDDAGRGSILGPLVIAGTSIEENRLHELTSMRVRDSKLLSRSARLRLYCQIKDVAHRVSVVKISPQEIDEYVFQGKKYRRLNFLEAIVMGRVAEELDAHTVYVDASDVDCCRFRDNVVSALKGNVKVVSTHHADRLYPIVSAASIIAKVERDSAIQEILEEYGNVGSGYPSDPRTIEFLKQWIAKNSSPPDFSRRSWRTFNKLMNRTL